MRKSSNSAPTSSGAKLAGTPTYDWRADIREWQWLPDSVLDDNPREAQNILTALAVTEERGCSRIVLIVEP